MGGTRGISCTFTNDRFEITSVCVTLANIADVKILENPHFVAPVRGVLIGDKGYIASEPVKAKLLKSGIYLIAKQRQNMDPYLNKYYSKLLNKRRTIERVFAYFKRSLAALHKFARTSENFKVHVFAAIVACIMRFTAHDKLLSLLA